jgi:arsenate reductase (thioredoxin)
VKAHWALPDPGAIAASELDIRLAFEQAFATLELRIEQLLALPLAQMSDEALSRGLARIGELA